MLHAKENKQYFVLKIFSFVAGGSFLPAYAVLSTMHASHVKNNLFTKNSALYNHCFKPVVIGLLFVHVYIESSI